MGFFDKDEKVLTTKMNEMFDECEGLLKRCLIQAGFDLEDIADIDDEVFGVIKQYIKTWTACKEIALEQCRLMEKIDKLDEVNEKLDRIEKLLKEKK